MEVARRRIAQLLAGLGSLDMLVGAILHTMAGYPLVKAALTASNLDNDYKNALRAVFLLCGFSWMIIAVVTLIAIFAEGRVSKAIIILCGLTLLLQIPAWVRLMGWFVGNEIFVVAGGLILIGGLLLPGRRSV